MRIPTEENSPKVGIDVQGQGVVAWQEPDDEFVDRVWARRVFGTTVGIPLLVSPSSLEGAPLRGPADAFTLDVSGFGQAAVAFRQQPGQASKLDCAAGLRQRDPGRLQPNSAGSFDGRPSRGRRASRGARRRRCRGRPARRLFAAGFGSGTVALLGSGDDAVGKPEWNGSTRRGARSPGDPLVDVAETGAAAAAWRELRGGAGLVGIQERRADGVVEPTC